MATVRQIFHKFLSTTSVKAIPRLIKSETSVSRLLWFLAFVWGASSAGYFLYKLIVVYISYSVTLVTLELEDSASLPDITACSLNPLANLPASIHELNITARMPETCSRCSAT